MPKYCVVENQEQLLTAAKQLNGTVSRKTCQFVYNDLCDEYIAGHEAELEQISGYSPYADPSTGFEISYENRFDTKPTFSECKFYDALLLTGFSAFYMLHYGETDFNQTVIKLTTMPDYALSSPAWDASVMEIYLHGLENGRYYAMKSQCPLLPC